MAIIIDTRLGALDTNYFFGSGADGNVTISSNTVIDSPFPAYNNLTIDNGFSLSASSGPMYITVKETLTVNGSLNADGLGGAGAPSPGTGAGAAGAAGGFTDWNGTVQASTLRTGPGGGANSFGPAIAGPFTGDLGLLKSMSPSFGQLFSLSGPGGGAGGGSLGGGGGGAGGNGGGMLYIFARNIIVSGTGLISSNGDDGINGSTAGGFSTGNPGGAGAGGFNVSGGGGGGGFRHGGGGGGGAGGGVLLVYESLSVSGTVEANGGTAGDGTGGSAGHEGGVGGTANITQPGIFNISAPTAGVIAPPATDGGGGGAGGDSGVVLPIEV